MRYRKLNCHFNQRDLKWKDFIVLFKRFLSCFISKLSLRSNLSILESLAKMLKSAKFMAHLHCNRLLGIATC